MKERYVILRDLPFEEVVTRGGGPDRGEENADRGVVVEGMSIDPREAQALQAGDQVRAIARAMPMRLIAPTSVPVKPVVEESAIAWGVEAVAAHTSPYTGQGIRVAVLDTGIDASHPAFAGMNLLIRDFTEAADEEGDSDGHGTHCAGTIFGRAVDGVRIGVAPGVTEALIGKVLSRGRETTSEQIATAIQWAVDEDAHVISMSLGFDFPGHVRSLIEEYGMPAELATSRALEDYRRNVMLFERLASTIRARRQSPLIVAAAGNESRREIQKDFEIGTSPPAVAEGILSVAAIGRTDDGWRVADFSNTGASVCAPGVDIVSAEAKGRLTSMSGTSMAAPHVAGVAALLAERALDVGQLHDGANLAAMLIGQATIDHLEKYNANALGQGLVRAPQAR